MDQAPVLETADTVTVLRAMDGRLLTKLWTRVGDKLLETAYDKAWRFIATEHRVSNVRDLGEFIQNISADPHSAIVRGMIADGANPNNILRRARPRRGAAPTLLPKRRRWVGLDLDMISCPDGIDPLFEPDATVEHAISLLPPAFHEVTCFWQFTSGHGLKPGIRLRLWYWLNRLTSDEELRRWLGERVQQDGVPRRQWPRRWPIDPALFNPIQLHYTATPIFQGLPDPVPVRCGWRHGLDDVVVIPDPLPVKERKGEFSTNNSFGEPGLGYEGWRARIGDHQGGDGFFRPINSAIGAFFFANGAKADADWLIQDLAAVIIERQGNRSDAYVADRLRDLPNAVTGIQAMQASREQEELEREKRILRFEGEPAGPLLLSERREDAEAVWRATGFETWACQAGFAKTMVDRVQIDRIVIVLIVGFDRFSAARRTMRRTIRQWQAEGRKVLQMTPRAISTGDGTTFADLLKEAGPEAVRARIDVALTPITLPRRMPVDEARQTLGDAIKTAFDELSSWTPPSA
jgi:hypothetical protein